MAKPCRTGDGSAQPRQQQRIALTVAWTVVGLFFITDLILLQSSRLILGSSILTHIISAALIVVALYAVAPLVRYRLASDETAVACWLKRRARGVELLADAVTFIVAFGLLAVTFSYLSTSLALPLRDAELAAIDAAVGFDWPAFLAWTNSSPAAATILRLAYHSSGLQFMMVIVLLCFLGKGERLFEFLAVLAVASLLIAIGMTLVPAEGAFAFYKPSSADFSNYTAMSGMWHHETLVRLRTDAAPLLDFESKEGLVTFPSFHTVLALIIPYALRDWPRLFAGALLLNTVVIIGTITEGGHHLIDIVAGALITGLSIVIVEALIAGLSRTQPSPRKVRELS